MVIFCVKYPAFRQSRRKVLEKTMSFLALGPPGYDKRHEWTEVKYTAVLNYCRILSCNLDGSVFLVKFLFSLCFCFKAKNLLKYILRYKRFL